MGYVYNIYLPDSNQYYPVGGENRSKAILNLVNEIDDYTYNFIYYRARKAKNFDGKYIETTASSILDIDELLPLGYRPWWDCIACGRESKIDQLFDYVKENKYKCRVCGHIDDIPYGED